MTAALRFPGLYAATALAVGLTSCAHEHVSFDARALHPAGQGAYSTELLPGEKGPSDRAGAPVTPKVTVDFRGPPPTNDWSSSLVWSFDNDPHSRPMFPHPLAMKADARGLAIGYPDRPVVSANAYVAPYAPDLRVSVMGLSAPETRIASWSDWAVTAEWANGGASPIKARLTFGHGLPFVYARTNGRPALVQLLDEGRRHAGQSHVLERARRGHRPDVARPQLWTLRAHRRALAPRARGAGLRPRGQGTTTRSRCSPTRRRIRSSSFASTPTPS